MTTWQYTDDSRTVVRNHATGVSVPVAAGNRDWQRLQRSGTQIAEPPIKTEPPEEMRRREAITSLVSSVQNVPLSELTAAHIRTIVILLLLWHRFIDLDDQGRVVVRFRQQ